MTEGEREMMNVFCQLVAGGVALCQLLLEMLVHCREFSDSEDENICKVHRVIFVVV